MVVDVYVYAGGSMLERAKLDRYLAEVVRGLRRWAKGNERELELPEPDAEDFDDLAMRIVMALAEKERAIESVAINLGEAVRILVQMKLSAAQAIAEVIEREASAEKV